jgi:hypothetical protein
MFDNGMRTPIVLIVAATAIVTGPQMAAAPSGRPGSHPALAGFHRAVEAYVELHRALEAGLPPLEITSDPAQLRRAVDARASAIRAARAGAQAGDIFTKEGGRVLRTRIHDALDRQGVAVSVLLHDMAADDEDGEATPAVNGAFPWMGGHAMWPFMIAALPPLPAELEYRFIGRDLVLLDVHAELIVDILPAALPLW